MLLKPTPLPCRPLPAKPPFGPSDAPSGATPSSRPLLLLLLLPPLEPFKLKASVAPMARSSSWNDGELVIPFCNDWLATDNAICFMLDTDDAEMIVCTGGALLDVLLLRFGDSGDDESAVGCCGCGCCCACWDCCVGLRSPGVVEGDPGAGVPARDSVSTSLSQPQSLLGSVMLPQRPCCWSTERH